MMTNFAEFTITARSRHPRINVDYDPVKHRYKPGYVNPGGWILELDASAAIKSEAAKNNFSYDWTIARTAGGFSKRAQGRGKNKVTFKVPTSGAYEVTLTARARSGGEFVHKQLFRLRDLLIVSIGDSYASGEGNPDTPGEPEGFDPDLSFWDKINPVKLIYELTKEALDWGWNKLKREFTTLSRAADATIDMDPAPVWLEARAHRSLRSGPAMAARVLENPQRGDVITFLSFARSGAEIEAGLLGPRTSGGKPNDGWIGNIGQIKEIKRTVGDKAIDALIISIGGNDVGFAGSLKALIEGDLFWKKGDDSENRQQTLKKVKRKLDKLASSFQRLADAISELNVRRVYLTEYPTALFDIERDGKVGVSSGCGIFGSSFDADIDLADARAIKKAAELLNDFLHTEATKYGWIYVGGIAEAFEGRGYCMGDRRLYVQVEESMVEQGDTEGTMHPNAKGHQIYSRQLRKALRRHTIEPKIWLEPALHVMMSR
jgi:hypothetical protein